MFSKRIVCDITNLRPLHVHHSWLISFVPPCSKFYTVHAYKLLKLCVSPIAFYINFKTFVVSMVVMVFLCVLFRYIKNWF